MNNFTPKTCIIFAEKQMSVPETVGPAELSAIIVSMTKLAAEERPTVEEVDYSLSQIYEKLSEGGEVAKFLGSE